MSEWSVVMGSGRRQSAPSVLLLVLCGMLLLSGCGLLRRSSDTPDPSSQSTQDSEPASEPTADPVEDSEEDTQSADESEEPLLPDQPPPTDSTPEVEPTESGGGADAEDADSASSGSNEAPPTEDPESLEVPENEGFVVDLPPEERAALQEQIRADLTTALEILDAWAMLSEVSGETSEQLQTVQDFVELSRAAVDEEDLLGASNLALKARILALEIGRP